MPNGKANGKDAMSDAFEAAFSDYLDSEPYDQAEAALFSIIREAYQAGWKAAGGDAPAELKVLHLSNP